MPNPGPHESESEPDEELPELSKKEFGVMVALGQLHQLLYCVVLTALSIGGIWMLGAANMAPEPTGGMAFWTILFVSSMIVLIDYVIHRLRGSVINWIVYWVGYPLADYIQKKSGVIDGDWIIYNLFEYGEVEEEVRHRLN